MHVAKLELCKKLYELSGWELNCHWIKQGPNDTLAHQADYPTVAVYDDALGEYPYFKWKISPAYDAGYLLRKLPYTSLLQKYEDTWQAWYFAEICRAENPEDALCLLAIELLKSAVLTGEHQTKAHASPKLTKRKGI